MSIDIKSLGGSPITRGNNARTKPAPSERTGPAAADTSERVSGDMLTLSGTAQKVLSELRVSLAQEPPVDQSRVGDLRDAIARNTYRVDALRVAEKFLRHEGALATAEEPVADGSR